jgi:hypothetical protein
LGFLLFLLSDPTLVNALIGVGILLGVFVITTFLLAVLTHRRLPGPISVHVDETGVEVETAVARSELRWSFFKERQKPGTTTSC